MAVRQVTRRYAGIGEFLADLEGTFRKGAIALAASEIEGELAPEVKVDLVLPIAGRVGPIPAQVVQRLPDGGVALRFVEIPQKVQASFDLVEKTVADVRDWLLATGQVVLPGQVRSVTPGDAGGAEDAPVAARRAPPPEPDLATPRTGRGEGFAIPDLADREPDAQGPLGDRSLRDVLVQLALDRKTGLLVVVEDDGRRRFGFWQRGGPVGWRSDPLDEADVLGVLLFRAGRITREQLAQSLEIMEAQGQRQGEALMQLGLLSFPQLVIVLQKQVEVILQKIMRIKSGVWAFFELEEMPEKFIAPPLRVPSLLFRALKNHTRELASETIASAHRPNLDRYVFLRPGVDRVLEEISFTAPESKFIKILQGNSWRLRELFSVSNLARSETANTLWAMNEMNFMDYRAEETRDRYLTRVGGRITSKDAANKKGSHFDVLEVHWICLPVELDRAVERLRKEFDPSRYTDLTPELMEAVKRIRGRVEESYRFLKNEAERRTYREEIIEKDKITQSAEILARKGEMAVMKNDRTEAVTCFAKAVELVPRNKEYQEGLARSQGIQT